MGEYLTNYPELDLTPGEPTRTGFSSRELVIKEEADQKHIAEYPEWLLARKMDDGSDSRSKLEEIGFKVLREFDDLFYVTTPPYKWTKKTAGYWTSISNSGGVDIMNQFFKGAVYDRDAHLIYQD